MERRALCAPRSGWPDVLRHETAWLVLRESDRLRMLARGEMHAHRRPYVDQWRHREGAPAWAGSRLRRDTNFHQELKSVAGQTPDVIRDHSLSRGLHDDRD